MDTNKDEPNQAEYVERSSKTSAGDLSIDKEEIVAPDGYRLISKLGEGTSATVYKALQLSTQRMVSIKLFNKINQDSDLEHNRFRREATILSELEHPNIQKVLSYTFNRDNAPAVISDYIDGKSLQEMLLEKTRLSEHEFVEIFGTLIGAMAYLHNHNVLHRDLKPANIIVGATSSSSLAVSKCTLIDFGLAKLITKADTEEKNKLTKTGMILGTVNYLSPEQGEGKVADEKSEVFTLGIIMFESINGYLPWSGENAMHTILLKKDSPPAAMRNDIPPAIRKLIERLLNKAPQLRPSMSDLQGIFQSPSAIQEMTQKGKKPRSSFIISILALICAIALAALFILQKKQDSGPEQKHPFKELQATQKLMTASSLAERHIHHNQPASMTMQNLQKSDSMLNEILSQKDAPKKYRYSAYCQLYSNACSEKTYSNGKTTTDPLTFLQKAIDCSKIGSEPAWDAYVAPILLGEYYEDQHHYQKSLDQFEEAKLLIEKYNDYKENAKLSKDSLALIMNLPQGTPGQMHHDAAAYVKFKIAYLKEELQHDDTALKKLALESVLPAQYRIKTIYLIIDHEERTSQKPNSKWRNNLSESIKVCQSKENDADSEDLAKAYLYAADELFGRHNNHDLAIDAILKANDIFPMNTSLDQILVQTKRGLKCAKDEHKPERIIKKLESALNRLQNEEEASAKKKSLSTILRIVPSP